MLPSEKNNFVVFNCPLTHQSPFLRPQAFAQIEISEYLQR